MSFRVKTFPTFGKFTLGTGNLRDPANPEHLKVARAAMDAGVWFHSAAEYGEGKVFQVLRAAFKEDPRRIPKCIFKIKSWSPQKFMESVREAIEVTGVPRVDVAQICWYMPDAQADLQPGCGLHDAMAQALSEGLVGAYVLEFFRPITDKPMAILQQDLFDGYIYYHNVVNREVSNAAYDLLLQQKKPILALRTVGGGAGDLGFSPREEGAATLKLFADLAARAGCADEMELRLRYPLSYSQNLTTIGATTSVKHLNAYLELNRDQRPLSREILEPIDALHRRWFAV